MLARQFWQVNGDDASAGLLSLPLRSLLRFLICHRLTLRQTDFLLPSSGEKEELVRLTGRRKDE
jgi:hypothetical protein